MKKVLFRCSGLGHLMTKPRTKSEKLSKTAKTFIEETWLLNEFGYREDVFTPEIMKGHLCEAESRKLIRNVLGGEYRERNTERFKNDFISGHPDIVLKHEDFVEDIKNPKSLKTFIKSEITKLYYWQLVGYMWLTGKTKARLIYTLNPDPFEIIEDAKKRLYFKFDCDEDNPDYITACAQIDHNNKLIEVLSDEKRLRFFEIELKQSDIDDLKTAIQNAWEYYNTLEL